mmetsp:Transcript_1514/g.4552  ORF Transcript_1514/g.4552 Transcript_1514/m.4552 type:complete len:168 (-) Transcript_1514:226-729(-)
MLRCDCTSPEAISECPGKPGMEALRGAEQHGATTARGQGLELLAAGHATWSGGQRGTSIGGGGPCRSQGGHCGTVCCVQLDHCPTVVAARVSAEGDRQTASRLLLGEGEGEVAGPRTETDLPLAVRRVLRALKCAWMAAFEGWRTEGTGEGSRREVSGLAQALCAPR